MAGITTSETLAGEQPKNDNLGGRVDELNAEVGELRKQFALLRRHVIDTEEHNTEEIETLQAVNEWKDENLEKIITGVKTETVAELKAWFDQKAFDELFTIIGRIEVLENRIEALEIRVASAILALENKNDDEDQL
jgi:uncharacterized coiled-coil protein SlyX